MNETDSLTKEEFEKDLPVLKNVMVWNKSRNQFDFFRDGVPQYCPFSPPVVTMKEDLAGKTIPMVTYRPCGTSCPQCSLNAEKKELLIGCGCVVIPVKLDAVVTPKQKTNKIIPNPQAEA